MADQKPMIISGFKPGSLKLVCDVPKCFALLGGLPTRKRWIERTLVFSPTGASIEYILKHWPDAQWEDDAKAELDRYLSNKMIEDNNREDKKVVLTDESGYQFKTNPFNHQLQGFLLGRDHTAYAYFHEQGCGKTKVVLDGFAYLWEHNLVDVLIIVAPNGVHSNWIVEEVPAHLPERIPAESYYYKASMKRRELLDIEIAAQPPTALHRDCIIVAFNVEGFTSKKACRLIEMFLKNHRCMMVIDESNSIQNHRADCTKYLTKIGERALFRRITNGTPITRGVENLFSQFKFLDPIILGHENYWTFRAQFCVMGGFQNKKIIAYQHLDELTKIIDGHSHRVLKKDCLDLPDKLYKKHFFEMTPQQLIAYETVRRQTLEELEEVFGKDDGLRLSKEIAITKLLRLQQIACGWAPTPAGDGPVALMGGNPRLEALLTLLANSETKGIIWCTAPGSKANIQLIAEQLRTGKYGQFVEYHGGVDSEERIKNIKRFQERDEVRWFLASKAAYRGLTLTAAQQAIYYTNSYDLGIRLQSEDRNHRIGSEIHDKVLYTDIYTNGVDKKIVASLRSKKALADLINQDPKSIFME